MVGTDPNAEWIGNVQPIGLVLAATIVAKVPNCPAPIFCCRKIRPTTADRCGPNHITEVASEFIFRQ